MHEEDSIFVYVPCLLAHISVCCFCTRFFLSSFSEFCECVLCVFACFSYFCFFVFGYMVVVVVVDVFVGSGPSPSLSPSLSSEP